MEHAAAHSTPVTRTPDLRTPPPKSKITARIEVVTPELAKYLLENKATNRPVGATHVRELANEINDGRWVPSHQGIALNSEGRLIDGQHRLEAVVKADRDVEMLVSYDVPDEAFAVIDQHRKRTAAQILSLYGVTTDNPRLTAMARAILVIVHKTGKVSNTAAAEYVVNNRDHMTPFLRIAKQFSPACAAAFAWAHKLGWSETVEAADRLATNGPWSEPQETDPMRALANRSRDFDALGSGQARIKAVFDITLNCLLAVHERRGLRHAKSTAPNYEKIERNSTAPREHEDLDSVHPPAHRPYTPSLFAPDARTEEQLEADRQLDEAIADEMRKTREERQGRGE